MSDQPLDENAAAVKVQVKRGIRQTYRNYTDQEMAPPLLRDMTDAVTAAVLATLELGALDA